MRCSTFALAALALHYQDIVRPSSWTDEYSRIFELFERVLAQPNGAAKKASEE